METESTLLPSRAFSEARRCGADTAVGRYAGEREEWDDFVRCAPGATVFHLIGWKDVLEKVFRFRAHYLVARRAGRMVGVLPLFELDALPARRCLLSLPFAVEGGVCCLDARARAALEAAAVDLMRERRARYVELRDGLEGSGFRVREGTYFRFRRRIAASDEENFAAIPRKQRRMVRVGLRSGLTSRVGTAHLPAFYDLYARSVRNLGTPVFPCRYFRLLCESLRNNCVLLTVWHGNTPAAGVLSFFFRGTVYPYYAGSSRAFFHRAVNDFMYWELMRLARTRGALVFDFGRSKKGTGAYEFKRHWGFEPEPLRYRVYVQCGADAPDRTAADVGVRLVRHIWRRLPLAVTKLIGPALVRRYGPYYT